LRQEIVAVSSNGTESGSWFNVYPNPGEGYMALALPYDGQTYHLKVYNAIGQLVYNNQFVADDPFQALSTSNWSNGMYVVQLSGNGLKENRKWLKAQ
jgi:Secretion system C-terminal sorting domain